MVYLFIVLRCFSRKSLNYLVAFMFVIGQQLFVYIKSEQTQSSLIALGVNTETKSRH